MLACEQILREAHRKKKFNIVIYSTAVVVVVVVGATFFYAFAIVIQFSSMSAFLNVGTNSESENNGIQV